jgi:hypothetical protein
MALRSGNVERTFASLRCGALARRWTYQPGVTGVKGTEVTRHTAEGWLSSGIVWHARREFIMSKRHGSYIDAKPPVRIILSTLWTSMLFVFAYVDIFGFWRADVIRPGSASKSVTRSCRCR